MNLSFVLEVAKYHSAQVPRLSTHLAGTSSRLAKTTTSATKKGPCGCSCCEPYYSWANGCCSCELIAARALCSAEMLQMILTFFGLLYECVHTFHHLPLRNSSSSSSTHSGVTVSSISCSCPEPEQARVCISWMDGRNDQVVVVAAAVVEVVVVALGPAVAVVVAAAVAVV